MTRFTLTSSGPVAPRAPQAKAWQASDLSVLKASVDQARTDQSMARMKVDQLQHDGRNLVMSAVRLLRNGQTEMALSSLQASLALLTARYGSADPLRRQLTHVRDSWTMDAQVPIIVRVSPTVSDSLPFRGLLISVIDNLVRNACRATSRGAVRVQISQSSRFVSVFVVDTGPGMQSGINGWGIGLDLVRSQLDQMGGELALTSKHQGGVRATIRIPLAAV